jgi:hypothetical protein
VERSGGESCEYRCVWLAIWLVELVCGVVVLSWGESLSLVVVIVGWSQPLHFLPAAHVAASGLKRLSSCLSQCLSQCQPQNEGLNDVASVVDPL